MLVRPRDLAERIAGVHHPETVRLPIDAARCKAREIINQSPQVGYTPIIENCPDGQIEFAIRYFPAAH